MAEFAHQVFQEGEVILNNMRLRVVGGSIGYELTNEFGRKSHQGDPGADDHPLNSVITQATWTGGIGTKKYRGDDSKGNSWWTTAWDSTENLLTFPIAVVTAPASTYAVGQETANVYVHEKFGTYVYASYGPVMRRWNVANQAPESFGSNNSPSTITGQGVVWGNGAVNKKLYIPCGSAYVTHDGSNFTAGEGGEGAISFVVWQQKLFKVDSGGVIKVLDPTDGVGWTEKGRLSNDVTPQTLFIFYDNDEKTAVHLATSGGTYILDYTNAILWETPLIYPDHPDSGRAATLWRADAYVSVGAGVHRDAKGEITAVGVDGREGLPDEYSTGYFTSFAAGYNGLLGLYRAYDPNFVAATETEDMGISPPEQMYSQEPGSYGILFEYDILGWHPRWVGRDIPTNVVIASVGGEYRSFWGGKGNLYSRRLPRSYFNALIPPDKITLDTTFSHITPYFNYGIDDNAKIQKQLEFKTRNCDTYKGFNIWLQVDDQTEWGNGVTAGSPFSTLTTNGEHHLDIGFQQISDELFHLGMTIERVRMKIDGFCGRDNVACTTTEARPAIEWYSLVGRPWMRANRVFSFAADLTEPYHDMSPEAMFDAIVDASTRKYGSTLVIGNKTFLVDLTSTKGNLAADLEFQAILNIDAAEIQEIDA